MQGRLTTPAEFEQLTIVERGGQLVRLGQVADVSDGHEEPRSIALFNGERAVGLDILKSKGYSTTRVAEGVVTAAERIQASLLSSVSLRVARNAGERVRQSVEDVQSALMESAAQPADR